MKSYTLTDAGLTEDEGVPAFKFEAELREGEDLDGKFHIQFAAVEREGDRRFALNSPRGLLAVFEPEASRTLANALAEHGEYIVLADYENASWADPMLGSETLVMLGRDFGEDVDWRERYTLEGEDKRAVNEIRRLLAQG